MNSTRILLTVLAGLVVGVAGCADLRAINSERDDRREFPFSGDRLTVQSDGTDVRLIPGARGVVTVDRHLTGKATTDGGASWSLTGDTLNLRVTCSGFVPDCGGTHVVAVPAEVAVQLTSHSGSVRSAGHPGDLTISVEDGWLRVEDPVGTLRLTAELTVEVTGARSTDVTATSEDRDVTLTFATPPKRVEARARTGDAEVRLPAGPETYRVRGSGLRSDPNSDRTVTAIADHGTARVRKGE